MRRGMEGILPPAIQWRGSKGSSTAVFFHGIQKYDRLLLDQIVNQDFSWIEDYIDIVYSRKYYSAVMDGQCQEVAALWFVITLALWFRYHRFREPEAVSTE